MEVIAMSVTTAEQRARMSEYFQNNKARYAHYTAEYRDKLKLQMVEAYGGECQWCGERDPIVLTLDHVDDDSFVEKQLYGVNARGGHKIYSKLKKAGWPQDRFQLLCHNCNARKEFLRRRESIVVRWGSKDDLPPKRAGEGVRASNRSGFKGVFWNSQKKKWNAKITVSGEESNLGLFDDIRDAARAYKKAAVAAWGASANVPTEDEIEQIAAAGPREPEHIVLDKSLDELGL